MARLALQAADHAVGGPVGGIGADVSNVHCRRHSTWEHGRCGPGDEPRLWPLLAHPGSLTGPFSWPIYWPLTSHFLGTPRSTHWAALLAASWHCQTTLLALPGPPSWHSLVHRIGTPWSTHWAALLAASWHCLDDSPGHSSNSIMTPHDSIMLCAAMQPLCNLSATVTACIGTRHRSYHQN